MLNGTFMDIKVVSEIASKYGWSAKEVAGQLELFNRQGRLMCRLQFKGARYKFHGSGGNLLMTGNGQIEKSLVKLLTEYFYASLVLPESK